jgi:gliding motility-associated-like protein
MGSALLFKVLLSVGLMGLHVQPATTPPPSLVKEAPSEAIANCNIFASFNGNIFCYDNGTPNDPTDDTFTTEVVVSGTMFGNNGWTATDPLSSSGPYDQVVVLGPYLIANGPFPITFQDVDDPTCTSITVTIHEPPPCSTTTCDLEVVGGGIFCNSNGTPGDPFDDFFTQNIVVTNGGEPGNWTSNDPNNASGIYGVSQTVGPYPGTGGDVTFTITDFNNPNCSITYTIPNPCTPFACNLSNPGLGFTVCDDNGTPNDPGDDFFTFPLDPIGTGLGSGYTVTVSDGILSPAGSTYGAPTTFTLTDVTPGTAISVIVTDDSDPNCITNTIINLPPACSNPPSCSINFSLLGPVTCDDNGTPNDLSDDTFTFPMEISGTGFGNNGWVANDPLNTSGPYNTVIIMGPYPAGTGPFTIQASDVDNPNCQTGLSAIVPPAPCNGSPPNCNINYSQVGNVVCNDNGTPNDPSDDFVTFDIEVVGTGFGNNGWIANDPLNTSGNYNTLTTMGPYPAPVNPIQLIVTDVDDPTCSTIPVTIVPPPPCDEPPPCSISATNTAPVCDDNGTPSDPSDDTFTFDVTVSGSNTAATWTADDPNNTTGNYNVPITFGPFPISGGALNFTIVDDNDPNCSTTVNVAPPATCSNQPPCTISGAGLTNVSCNDGGTPNDPTDDFVEFSLEPFGVNLIGQYDVLIAPGSVTPPQGTYGTPTSFATDPDATGNGTITVTIVDGIDPTCTFTVLINDPCANQCSIAATATATVCNDNGTPSDPSDDTFTFEVTVTGNNTGAGWTANDPNSTAGGYNTPTTFGPYPITGGPITFSITDTNDPSCSTNLTVTPPPTCSNQPPCSIQANIAGAPLCNDNGTPSFPDDDTYTFNLLVTGTNSGSGWTADDPLSSTGNYGQVITLGPYLILNGPLTITITDNSDPNCTDTFTLSPPASCSDQCNLQTANLGVFLCVDNGTPSDPNDDFIEFTLDPTGQNLSTEYIVAASSGFITPNTASYGAPTTFITSPGTAGNGPITLTITDSNDLGCEITVILPDPGVCSSACNLFPNLQSVDCLDNGTPSDPSDDLFTASVLVSGSGTGWTADDPANTSGTYGTPVTFGPYPIANGPVIILFTDADDPTCQTSLTITPPPTCSNDCLLETTISNILCDDNGTPGVSTDDTFTAILTVTETNGGPGWTAGPPVNQVGTYGTPVVIGPFPTNLAEVIFTVVDDADPNCNAQVTITSPGGCSTGCPAADSTFVNLASCNPQDTGFVVETFSNTFGCDSLVFTTTSLLPSDTTLLSVSSCNPIDTGTVETLLSNQFGCDSLIITTTALLPTDTTLLVNSSCNPQDTGIVEALFSNQFGCDSLVITQTNFQNADTTFLFLESCNPQDTGVVEQLFSNQFGCDSTVFTNTTLLPSDTTFIFVQSCNPQDTGVVINSFSNQFGCDSTVIANTTLLPSDTTFIFAQSCNPQDTGVVINSFNNQFGCDSTVIANTTLLPSDTTFIFAQSCNPQDTGVVINSFNNQFGCDSTVIANTTLLPSDTTFIFAQSCNPQDTGVVINSFSNQFGCDSTVIANTTLLPSDTTFIFAQSCNPQDTGVVINSFSNQFGCDSTVIANTTLLPSDTTFIFAQSCNPQDTGIVINSFSNQFGCDSTVIANTTLLPSDTTFIFAQSCNPQDTGIVINSFSNQFGCDSTVIANTTLLPTPVTTLNPPLCFGESIQLNGSIYNANNPAGVDTLLAANGCDSLVFVQVQLLPPPETIFIDTLLCAGATFEFNGQVYDANNPGGTQVVTGQSGCDSVLINISVQFSDLELILLPQRPSCEGLPGSVSIRSSSDAISPLSYSLDGQDFQVLGDLPQVLTGLFPGSYSLTIQDGLGCTLTEAFTITEGVNPTLDLGEDLTLELGESLQLEPTLNFSFDTLIWTPAEVLSCSNCLNPVLSTTENTLLTLEAFSLDGCGAMDQIRVRVDRRLNIYIPNVFSPNADGVNDYFTLFPEQGKVSSIRRLAIFDRWGNQVFVRENFAPGIEPLGWDGTFRGEPMNPAVFVFYAQLELVDGSIEQVEGEVTLLR